MAVAHHRQMYLDAPADPIMRAMRADLEPLYLAAGVDLVLAAHAHTYARTCAVRRGQCEKTGPVYIVDGTAGAYTGSGNQGISCEQPRQPFANPLHRAQDCMWGWSTLAVNATTLQWVHKRWDSGDVSDSITLTK